MRQNAVSSAPQNDALTHSDETSASSPTLVETRSTPWMAATSVESAALGKMRLASSSTDSASSCERSTLPATNSAISASGNIESIRL